MSFTIQLSEDWDADGWTLVPRGIIRDTALSWKAKGLVAWLASHDRNFSINREFIVKAGPDGEDSVKAGLRELRQAGYLSVERGHDDQGRLTSEAFYRLHRNPDKARSEPNGGKSTSGETHQEENPPGGKSGTKRDQSLERAQEQDTTTAAPEGAEQQPATPHLQAVPDLNPEQAGEDEGPTLNQRAVVLAQAHYERLGKMGRVPAFMKIIRKALEHGYPDDVVDRACAYIAEHRWTLTEEKLANTLRGGPRRPAGPPPAPGPQPNRPADAAAPRRPSVQGV